MANIDPAGGNANRVLALTEIQLCKTIKAHIAKGEQHYISAGLHLAKLKERCPDQATFLALVKDKIGIGKSRIYELLTIADGTKTVEGVRADTNERKRRHLSVPNGQTEEDEVERDRKTCVALFAAVEAAEAERDRHLGLDEVPPDILAKLRAAETKIEELQTENAELRRQLEAFKSPVRCEFVEDDGGRAAAGYGEAEGDCVARAITIATGKPYAEVFEALKAAHIRRVKRLRPGGEAAAEERRRSDPIHNGCHEKVSGSYLKSLGWQYTRIKERRYLRAGALPPGRLIVSVNGHYVAVIDGVIRDTYDSGGHGKRPMNGYWSRAAAEERKALSATTEPNDDPFEIPPMLRRTGAAP